MAMNGNNDSAFSFMFDCLVNGGFSIQTHFVRSKLTSNDTRCTHFQARRPR